MTNAYVESVDREAGSIGMSVVPASDGLSASFPRKDEVLRELRLAKCRFCRRGSNQEEAQTVTQLNMMSATVICQILNSEMADDPGADAPCAQ